MNCQVKTRCGSCQYIGTDYQQQLVKKQKDCQKLFQDFPITIHPVVGMENPYQYRNKVIVAFNRDYEYGLYKEKTHDIVPEKNCLLHDDETCEILLQLQRLFKKYRLSIYDEKRKKGFLRHVLIRRAVQTNQTLVALVATDGVFKGSKSFCQELTQVCPSIKTIVLNVNKRQTSVVLSQDEKILYGKGFIVDELHGLTFKISAQSFYQINHEQCQKLYQKVIDLLIENKNQTVLDTYCGIGTIGMIIAKQVDKVIGVEYNKKAYQDAITNAKMNRIHNIRFFNQDATAFMQNFVKEHGKVDCIIMDPPRSGSTKDFVLAINSLKPKQIIYISCDPTTQVRDLAWFWDIGYRTQDLYPYDMFPHTDAVETVFSLTRSI